MTKTVVVGGGIAGVVSALAVAQGEPEGDVWIIEKGGSLFSETSGMNPGRSPQHHYPDENTARASVHEAINSALFLVEHCKESVKDELFAGFTQNRDGPARNTTYFADTLDSIEDFNTIRWAVQDEMIKQYFLLSPEKRAIINQFWPPSSLFSQEALSADQLDSIKAYQELNDTTDFPPVLTRLFEEDELEKDVRRGILPSVVLESTCQAWVSREQQYNTPAINSIFKRLIDQQLNIAVYLNHEVIDVRPKDCDDGGAEISVAIGGSHGAAVRSTVKWLADRTIIASYLHGVSLIKELHNQSVPKVIMAPDESDLLSKSTVDPRSLISRIKLLLQLTPKNAGAAEEIQQFSFMKVYRQGLMITPYNEGLALTIQEWTNLAYVTLQSGSDYSRARFELYPNVAKLVGEAVNDHRLEPYDVEALIAQGYVSDAMKGLIMAEMENYLQSCFPQLLMSWDIISAQVGKVFSPDKPDLNSLDSSSGIHRRDQWGLVALPGIAGWGVLALKWSWWHLIYQSVSQACQIKKRKYDQADIRSHTPVSSLLGQSVLCHHERSLYNVLDEGRTKIKKADQPLNGIENSYEQRIDPNVSMRCDVEKPMLGKAVFCTPPRQRLAIEVGRLKRVASAEVTAAADILLLDPSRGCFNERLFLTGVDLSPKNRKVGRDSAKLDLLSEQEEEGMSSSLTQEDHFSVSVRRPRAVSIDGADSSLVVGLVRIENKSGRGNLTPTYDGPAC